MTASEVEASATGGTQALGRYAAERRLSRVSEEVLPLDLVSAYAGDRTMTAAERKMLDELRLRRDSAFFADLLYALTHERFTPCVAEGLWIEILQHKVELSEMVKRNVRIAVAALDYLSNLKNEIKSPTLIGESHVAEITRLALHDGLTRLFNHATCYEKIAVELRIYHRYRTPAALMMVDVDDFKAVNDRYGHPAGDRVLAALGGVIDATTRESDICCRYGGEEFAVILPSTEAPKAVTLAERLRATTERSPLDGKYITLSIGVAGCGPDTQTAEDLIEKADKALYGAKRAGKNRVASAPETDAPPLVRTRHEERMAAGRKMA